MRGKARVLSRLAWGLAYGTAHYRRHARRRGFSIAQLRTRASGSPLPEIPSSSWTFPKGQKDHSIAPIVEC